jgi:uncharacterized protein
MSTPVFPLGTAYLPGELVVLNVFEPRYLELFSHYCNVSEEFISVLIERGSEVGGDDVRCEHGVSITVQEILSIDNRLVVSGVAHSIVDIIEWSDKFVFPAATAIAQSVDPIEMSDRFDVASSLSLLAQNVRRVHALLQEAGASQRQHTAGGAIETIAAGRWWDERVTQDDLWRAMWLVARQVPCGPMDRYSLLRPGTLIERADRLRRIVEHVTEIANFRFSE